MNLKSAALRRLLASLNRKNGLSPRNHWRNYPRGAKAAQEMLMITEREKFASLVRLVTHSNSRPTLVIAGADLLAAAQRLCWENNESSISLSRHGR